MALAGAGEDANATGDLDITGRVTIRGAGAGLTVIDGQQLDRVFDVIGTGPSSIKVVLRGTDDPQRERVRPRRRHPGRQRRPGGPRLRHRREPGLPVRRWHLQRGLPGTGNVKLVRTTVARNVAAADGGGICVVRDQLLTVRDSTVRRNLAGGEGGGIKAATAALTNSTVSGNAAAATAAASTPSTATLTNSTVSGNTAGELRRRHLRQHGDADQLHRQRQQRGER